MSKSPSIIIEGPDGMGKSRLGKDLSKHLASYLYVCGPPPKNALDILLWTEKHQKSVAEGGNVLDRVTAFSHYVYDGVLGDNKYESMLFKKAVTLAEMNPIVIYCKTKTVNHEVKSYDDPKRVERILENIPALQARYEELFKKLNITPIVYDWTKPDAFKNLLEQINGKSR
jgi:hypothetical protein